MSSFREQMEIHHASRLATAALETASRIAIEDVFIRWENGQIEKVDVRWELERILRNAYRTSAGVARGVAIETADIYEWVPQEVLNTEYMGDLLEDIRRNLRAYKRGDQTREASVLRIQHSAGVAAQRGYTDQIIEAYAELEDFGVKLRKYWVANFVNNDPCASCRRLHGTWVGLRESFSAETGEPGVYRDLLGPPRHPRCQCRLYIFTITLENAFHAPDFDNPQEAPTMMSVAEVKKMAQSIFDAIRGALMAILKFLRGKKRR